MSTAVKIDKPVGLDVEPKPHELTRFLAKVSRNTESGCWEWEGYTDAKGYGQFRFRGKSYWAHRIAYAFFRRPLVPLLTVEHKCQNPGCVNPWHLELLSNSENAARGGASRNGNGHAEEVPF